MKNRYALPFAAACATAFATFLAPSLAAGQGKEDLLSTAPLAQEQALAVIQSADVNTALNKCGAGKMTGSAVTLSIDVSAAGKASLAGTNPILPPDVGGCIGGVLASTKMPVSGTGGNVVLVFQFGAVAPPPQVTSAPKPQFNPRYTPEFLKAKRIRSAGLGLVIPGTILFGIGIIALAAGLAADGEEIPITIGGALIGTGLVFMIPGIALAAVGKKRAEAVLRSYNTAMLPGILLDPDTGTYGLTLTAWF